MNNFISLKILDRFKFLYEKLGIDYEDMRLILRIKLTIDSRKTSALLKNQQIKESLNQYKIMLLIYTFIGFFMMMIMLMNKNTLISMTIYFTIIMFFMLTTFMSDFSSVILDINDKGILSTRGVSLKTLSASKITHIMIYMIRISMSLSGFSLIASIKYGLVFSLVFLIEILLVDIFIIIVSGLVYLLVLKLFNGEKLKDVISIIQICITILFSGAYFIIMNITKSVNLIKNIHLGAISYILPPFWFAAPFEIIVTGNKNETLLILSLLSLVVPVISVLIYIKLSPVFEKKLQKLNNGSSKNKKKYNLTMKLSKIICKDKEERIFFNFVSKIIRNDRDFKFKVYPIIGTYYTFPIYMIFDKNEKYINSYMYLFLYFCLMIIPTIIIALKFSKNYKASYIYTTINIKNKMIVHKAAIKACLINLIIPLYLIQCIVFIYFYKVSIIQHLVAIFLVLILITILTFKILDKSMPFSCQINILKKNEAIVENYLMIILIFIIAAIHFLVSIFGTLAVNIYIIAILTADIFLYKSVFK
ncbi:MAG: hypothetical protein E7C86_06180 [Paeniclostridium sordellii]|uniref:ABC transporter permease n=1 Tax=Paeniclostridium hominis TaxID=2764329 RepID=A0ABR7K7E0_9FIRM|nr:MULTISPECIES: hypothetical protein [Paeniclostridium]MBC6005017.1 hypothetical protein [Paeniclostridium hominis]MDU2592188.1 hypothetical protein [Paeniclostridium sordellii]